MKSHEILWNLIKSHIRSMKPCELSKKTHEHLMKQPTFPGKTSHLSAIPNRPAGATFVRLRIAGAAMPVVCAHLTHLAIQVLQLTPACRGISIARLDGKGIGRTWENNIKSWAISLVIKRNQIVYFVWLCMSLIILSYHILMCNKIQITSQLMFNMG